MTVALSHDAINASLFWILAGPAEHSELSVDLQRDAIDWILFVIQVLALVATAVAAYLAWQTIKQSKVQAKRAHDALLRERRIDFELGMLKDLVMAVTRLDHANTLALARMLPDVSMARAVVGLPSTPAAEARVGQLDSASHPTFYLARYQQAIIDELLDAIDTRTNERDQTPSP